LALDLELLITDEGFYPDFIVRSIVRDASKEVTSDVLVDSQLAVVELARQSSLNRGDRRMISSIDTLSRLVESVLNEVRGIPTVLVMLPQAGQDFFEVEIRRECG